MMQSDRTTESMSSGSQGYNNTLDHALKTFQAGTAGAKVIVDGVVDPENLRLLAKLGSLDTKLLEPGTATIRSVMLASRPLEFLVVRFISIGRYIDENGNMSGLTPDKKIRDQVASNLASLEEQAQSTQGMLNGYARTRSVKFYGQAYFTAEQQAIFLEYSQAASLKTHGALLSSNKNWSGLLLNEAGGSQLSNPAWTIHDSNFCHAEFLPSTMRNFSSNNNSRAGIGERQWRTLKRHPSPFDLQCINQASPLDFATDLLTESALNWSQFLAFLRNNMLQSLPVEASLEGLPLGRNSEVSHSITESLRLLRQARAHLTEAVEYFDDTRRFLDVVMHANEDQLRLPSVSTDFEDLRHKAIDISNLCKEKIDTINNYLSLQSSLESLHEGKLVKRLTYIGIVYAAVSLSSSIFGMNVTGLGGSVPWYYFLVVAIGLVLTVAGGVGILNSGSKWLAKICISR